MQAMPTSHAAQSRSAPGDRRLVSNFFDQYPIFYETTATAPAPGRLNLRYDAIFEQNREIFAGARVLDIASHDGRWSFAALQAGAAHVIGVEPRADLVSNARSTLSEYVEATRFRFIEGDIFEVLKAEQFQVDVVMCLGFLYHTLRYNELFAGIRRLNPKHVVIDTTIFLQSEQRVVKLDLDAAVVPRDAVRDEYSHGQFVLVGSPTLPGLEMMLNAYDFKVERLSDWAGLIRDNPEAEGIRKDYGTGRRITLLASSSTVTPSDLPLRGYAARAAI
jgi:2-polyprenyl-3-methyl-5-hydroxy-6-metoxy-1,4-benzoquinol methylase